MEFNNYSEKLKKELEEAFPKKGEKVIFRALKPINYSAKAVDTVYDEGADRPISIAYITSRRGVYNEASTRESVPVIPRIPFANENEFKVVISGDNPNQKGLFNFLYLWSKNINNKKRRGHRRPLNGYKVELYMPNKARQKEIDFDMQVTKAKTVIYEMKDEEFLKVGKGMFHNYQSLSVLDVKAKLLKLAEKDPVKIMHLSEEVMVHGVSLVRACEDANIITFVKNTWRVSATDAKICGVSPKLDRYEQLVNVLSEDAELRNFLIGQHKEFEQAQKEEVED